MDAVVKGKQEPTVGDMHPKTSLANQAPLFSRANGYKGYNYAALLTYI